MPLDADLPSVYAWTIEKLVSGGLIAQRDLDQGRRVADELKQPLPSILVRLGACTEEDFLNSLSQELGLPLVHREELPDGDEPFKAFVRVCGLPVSWFATRRAVGWQRGATLFVAAADPIDPALREAIEAAADRSADDETEIVWLIASAQVLEIGLARMNPHPAEAAVDRSDGDPERLREMAEEAPVIDFVNKMFADAVATGASDVHLEAYEHGFMVRFRRDGVLHRYAEHGMNRFEAIVSRIKLTGGMDIAERRLPQDGRNTVRLGGQDVDLRVSSVPSSWGESVVVRLLRKQAALPDLKGLGITGRSAQMLDSLLQEPHGILLVTGPTGSGKSTTLYRSLEQLSDGRRKIITIEDPVEYDMTGVQQIQVRPEIGYDFARGLRAVLRQDPDVIMVGEIRDGETATIAAQAALTGHYVLSTLHTNTALEAPTRLDDLGLPRYLIAAAVRGLIAQRLVRRVCPGCSEPTLPPEDLPANLASTLERTGQPAWRRAVGCEECEETGYRGRVAIFEIAVMNESLATAMIERASTGQLTQIARQSGFRTLFEDGVEKARLGLTTADEVFRVCGIRR